jgi:hypothetical protein
MRARRLPADPVRQRLRLRDVARRDGRTQLMQLAADRVEAGFRQEPRYDDPGDRDNEQTDYAGEQPEPEPPVRIGRTR